MKTKTWRSSHFDHFRPNNGHSGNGIELTFEKYQLSSSDLCSYSWKMMTRREKLLVRPWQLRRYNNHKRKVVNAVPIIDFSPPSQRRHVTVKLKKLQKERERQKKIEEDNFKLLQHLSAIMRQKRVDNYWQTKPPTFLRRVNIYHRTRTPTPCEEITPITTPEVSGNRKSKCLACTPQPEPSVMIPEERIPWEPQKKILTRRLSSSAVVPISSDFDFPQVKIHCKEVPKASKPVVRNKVPAQQHLEFPTVSAQRNLAKMARAEQKIVINQGPAQIAVNFPPFAEVKLVRGKSEKYLQRDYCECKSFRAGKLTQIGGRQAENKMIFRT